MGYLHGINDAIKVVLFDVITIYLKSEADHAVGGKLLDKNAKESWEIIENLILFDHESWDDPRDFAKPVKEISSLQDTLRKPDRRLLELEDQISFLLKGLLKELTVSRNPEKVLVRKEARYPITKNVNAISLVKMEKEKDIKNNKVVNKNVIELSELNAIKPKEVVDLKKKWKSKLVMSQSGGWRRR
ncbi:hypothetical protein Tco_0829726 [Tanacetum coccineum]